MDSSSISLKQINSLADLVPKVPNGPKIPSRPPIANSLADLVPGGNYSSRVLLFQFSQIEAELAINNPEHYNVMEYLTVNKRFDELERFIDAGLINFNPNPERDNPLADFIMEIIPRHGAGLTGEHHIEQILRIVNKVTNAENANISGLRNTPLAHLRELDDETFAIKLADILIDKGSICTKDANVGNQDRPYVMAALVNADKPRFQLAEHLMNRGIPISDLDSDGNSILHRLNMVSPEHRQSVAKFALKHGVLTTEGNSSGLNAIAVAIDKNLEQAVIDILDPTGELKSNIRSTPFTLLTEGKYDEIQAEFRKGTTPGFRKIDIDARNSHNKTLLYEVIQSDPADVGTQAKSLGLVKFLLANKANPNLYHEGRNYIQLAIIKQREDIAHALLDAGASPDLLHSSFSKDGIVQRAVSMSAAAKVLKVSPGLIEKINKKSYFSENELEALKVILDALITQKPTSETKTLASATSIEILEALGIEKRPDACIFSSDLVAAFNQIMLNPISINAFVNFNNLAINFHGAEGSRDDRLALFAFGHDFTNKQIVIRLSQQLEQETEQKSEILMRLYINKAILACYYDQIGNKPLCTPDEIRSNFIEARSIAENLCDYQVIKMIEDVMEKFAIPTFE